MDYPYVTVDVFTNTRFGGNPLAVILDGRGLSDGQMQQIAAEFGYSETTFVLPPADPANTARVRIFTTTAEVPFAGHPNVGTAYALAAQGELFGAPLGDDLRFEEAAGLVRVAIVREEGQLRGAAITAPQPLSVGAAIPAEVVAACAGLPVEAVALHTHPPQIVSVGLPFVVAELRARADLAAAQPSAAHFAEANRAYPHQEVGFALFLYVPLDAEGARLAARMFAGLDEDPATGSASAALAAYRAARLAPADSEVGLVIQQGEDMGRPSQIAVQVQKVAGAVARVVVQGACVPVMRGALTVA